MEYIIAFNTTKSAISAEEILLIEKISVKVMPLPKIIRAGCGICLRVEGEYLDNSIKLLEKKSIDDYIVLLKIIENNTVSYKEVSK